MIKATSAVLGLAIATAGAAPYWFGKETEEFYFAQLASLEARPGIDIVDSRFNGGWFRSTARTTIKFERPPIEMNIEHEFAHGPLPRVDSEIAAGRFKVALSDAVSRVRIRGVDAARTTPLLTVRTLVELDGVTTGIITIPASSIMLDNETRLDSKLADGDYEYNPNQKSTAIHLELPTLTLTGKSGTIEFRSLLIESNAQRVENQLSPGQMRVSAKHVVLRQAGVTHAPIALRELTVTSILAVSDVVVDYVLRVGFDSLSAAGHTYGPGSWEFMAEGLDPVTMAKVQKVAAVGDTAQSLSVLVDALNDSKPVLRSSLNVETTDGPITGQAQLEVQPPTPVTNVFQLLQAVALEVMLEFPEYVAVALISAPASSQQSELQRAQLARDQLERWVTEGRLVRLDDSRYQFAMRYADSALSLNGAPVTLPLGFGTQ